MRIANKRQSTAGYASGLFGNHLRQWDTPEQALRECSAVEFGIRYRGKGANGPCMMSGRQALMRDFYEQNWREREELYPTSELYISERAPDHLVTLQGEIMEWPATGYALHASTAKTFMRKAFSQNLECFTHNGPGALLIVKQRMDPESFAQLKKLLRDYPGHVVEFTCFSVNLGNLRRNTIFWEVRDF